jgi:hypothetical protein
VIFTSGGVTMVWWRLSASGGTETMGCFANSGFPLTGLAALGRPVSRGGKYSDGE